MQRNRISDFDSTIATSLALVSRNQISFIFNMTSFKQRPLLHSASQLNPKTVHSSKQIEHIDNTFERMKNDHQNNVLTLKTVTEIRKGLKLKSVKINPNKKG